MVLGLRACQTKTCFAFWVVCLLDRIFFRDLAILSKLWHFIVSSTSVGWSVPPCPLCRLLGASSEKTDGFCTTFRGSGLSGEANQMESFENILFTSSCVFHLPNLLCCLTSQMSYTEIKYMIGERGRAWWLYFGIVGSWKLLPVRWRKLQDYLDTWETRTCWSIENNKVVLGRHSKTRSWDFYLTPFIPATNEDFFFFFLLIFLDCSLFPLSFSVPFRTCGPWLYLLCCYTQDFKSWGNWLVSSFLVISFPLYICW